MAASDILFLDSGNKKFTFISGEMAILVFFGFGFNTVTNFAILTEILVLPLTIQDLLRSCVFVSFYGCKGSLLLEQFVLEVELLPPTSPLTLVNGISCCFPDGAGMNAT